MQRALPLLALVLVSLAPAGSLASPDAEAELCLQSLREGERARVEEALGAATLLPLYRANLSVDPKTREVTGQVQLRYLPGEAIDAVHLRVTPNAFGGAPVKLSEVTLAGAPLQVEHPEPDLYRLVLPERAAPNQPLSISFKLEAKVPKATPRQGGLLSLAALGAGMGSGPSDHGAFAAHEDFVSLVGVLPQVPHEKAPGQPADGPSGLGDFSLFTPSNFLVSVLVPSGFRAHGSGTALGEVPERGGRTRFTFAAGAARDFPLFVSKGYAKAEAKWGDVTLESHHREEDKARAEEVLALARGALDELQKRLGPYPYKTFKIVEAPLVGGAGGMEFSGMITVAEALFAKPEDPFAALGLGGLANLPGASAGLPDLSRLSSELLEFTVAHEVAHQWFAGLVGTDPVDSPVLDEPLAQYAALLVIEAKRGKKAAEAAAQQHFVQPYQLYRMSGGKDGAADRPTGDFDSPMEYGALVYSKAPMFHRAARKVVGDAAYGKALRAYVDLYRYKVASDAGFLGELWKISPKRADELSRLKTRWFEEAKGDEDLGAPDMKKLMEGLSGQAMDPQTEALLRQLLPALGGP